MAYRCVATSVAGFVQQLAVAYIANGYWFYVAGRIPERKEPAKTDAKIIAQYGLDVSKWTRARCRKVGAASVQYLRCGRFYVIVATHGEHPFFAAEGRQVHDFRRRPLFCEGYSIGCRRARGGGAWHASVRIQRERCGEEKARLAALALTCSVEEIAAELRGLRWEPYAPVREQLHGLLRAINRRRKAAGLELVPSGALWWRRRPVRPFE